MKCQTCQSCIKVIGVNFENESNVYESHAYGYCYLCNSAFFFGRGFYNLRDYETRKFVLDKIKGKYEEQYGKRL